MTALSEDSQISNEYSSEEDELYHSDDDISLSDSQLLDDDYEELELSESEMTKLNDQKLKEFQEKHDKTGVVYMSRVPPNMQPHKVRTLLQKYGEINRIYLAREDEKIRRSRVKMGGNRRKQYKEGWIEFQDKRIAKLVAATLNSHPMCAGAGIKGGCKGGNKYSEDLWTLKYLPRFKWVNLKEQIAYERVARQKKMQVEMDQAKKEINLYLRNVDKSKMIAAMEEKRKTKRQVGDIVNDEEQKAIRKMYRQRKAQDVTETAGKSQKVAKVLNKIFG